VWLLYRYRPFIEYQCVAVVQIQAISRVAKYVLFFLSDYLLRLGLFLVSSIILFYDVSNSDYRQTSFHATVMFLKKLYKLQLCKLNTKFPLKKNSVFHGD